MRVFRWFNGDLIRSKEQRAYKLKGDIELDLQDWGSEDFFTKDEIVTALRDAIRKQVIDKIADSIVYEVSEKYKEELASEIVQKDEVRATLNGYMASKVRGWLENNDRYSVDYS